MTSKSQPLGHPEGELWTWPEPTRRRIVGWFATHAAVAASCRDHAAP